MKAEKFKKLRWIPLYGLFLLYEVDPKDLKYSDMHNPYWLFWQIATISAPIITLIILTCP